MCDHLIQLDIAQLYKISPCYKHYHVGTTSVLVEIANLVSIFHLVLYGGLLTAIFH